LQNKRDLGRYASQHFIFCVDVIFHGHILDKFDAGHRSSVALAAFAKLCDAEIAAFPVGITRTVFDIQLISNRGIMHAAQNYAAGSKRLLFCKGNQAFHRWADRFCAYFGGFNLSRADKIVPQIS
jgi:hypothetical protein